MAGLERQAALQPPQHARLLSPGRALLTQRQTVRGRSRRRPRRPPRSAPKPKRPASSTAAPAGGSDGTLTLGRSIDRRGTAHANCLSPEVRTPVAQEDALGALERRLAAAHLL